METTHSNPTPAIPKPKGRFVDSLSNCEPAAPSNVLYGNFAPLAARRTRPGSLKPWPAWTIPPGLLKFLRELRHAGEKSWRAFATRVHREPRTLFVKETAALGDRRIVAVVQFEGQRFLIGSSPSSVTLLASLPDRENGGTPSESKEPSEHAGVRTGDVQ